MLGKEITILMAACLLAVSAWPLLGKQVDVMSDVSPGQRTTTKTEATTDVTTSAANRCTDPFVESRTNDSVSDYLSDDELVTQVESSAGFSLSTRESCPSGEHTYRLGEELNRRSMCPWHYEKDLGKEDRIPEFLYHAVCNCTNCQLPGAVSSECTPMIEHRLVLYREDCIDGVIRYTKKEEPVSVGCICSHTSRN